MTEINKVIVFCDVEGCDEDIEIKATSVEQARGEARDREDWAMVHGKDMCPKCNPFITSDSEFNIEIDIEEGDDPDIDIDIDWDRNDVWKDEDGGEGPFRINPPRFSDGGG